MIFKLDCSSTSSSNHIWLYQYSSAKSTGSEVPVVRSVRYAHRLWVSTAGINTARRRRTLPLFMSCRWLTVVGVDTLFWILRSLHGRHKKIMSMACQSNLKFAALFKLCPCWNGRRPSKKISLKRTNLMTARQTDVDAFSFKFNLKTLKFGQTSMIIF
jgi:hypothetical protein